MNLGDYMMEYNKKKVNAFKIGLYVFILLAVLTIIEYGMAIAGLSWGTLFFGIAAVKAWYVINKYMHFPRLFTEASINNDN
jgi:O-antigen/teichoic acid export membrane protein